MEFIFQKSLINYIAAESAVFVRNFTEAIENYSEALEVNNILIKLRNVNGE